MSQPSRGPSESRGPVPFLSLSAATGEGPGKALDLGTLLPWHSMIAWMDGHEGQPLTGIMMSLDVSHDGVHWAGLARGQVLASGTLRLPGAETSPAWPARYVRARIYEWPRGATTGRVYATIASA